MKMNAERIYGRCNKCGDISYREPGKRHGDGQQDSDDNQVWLLSIRGDDAELPGRVDGLDAEGIEIGDCTRHCCGS